MNQDFLRKMLTATEHLLVGGPTVSARSLREARDAAGRQFHEYVAKALDGTLLLAGANAQILEASHSYSAYGGQLANYVLTLIVVTEKQRYFLFKSNLSGQPFIKELTADRARIVLKAKFRPFARGDA
jgi:hypothetical protein